MLSLGIDRHTVEQAIEEAGLQAQTRGEALSMADFARLADTL
jgi:16S rRNA A1518/A1519 N6-dimethyltransferase RsmA/KsgA/DIM1 with predicted DNA glycosylase/AP lyase activity